eukprot:CAMPEP_0201867716 /NCGR_PEP_ID=MMETSP0902-20130614/1856_1 /ASSEMBLY_ACC=CAM_ASM_000551 /TAXON_ID=420261 /ORGANISM="Thalassiosira antarctica, Strain CCMP982" /LENGTH=243 /DNA_ID=CAMNT_0048392925 /DNA_START=34 /DNA_END=765 /DNA_ORIENTATION=+
MKLAILTTIAGSAAAFSPSAAIGASSSALHMSEPTTEETTAPIVEESPFIPAPAPLIINGWSADAALPMYGLPGAVAPLGFFDPIGFSKDKDLNTVKRLREAEVLHGRVSMMAAVGYLVGESTPTITYGMDVHHTIANNQLPEVPAAVLVPFFLAINFSEALRASVGWVEPGAGPGSIFSLREKYYPGDIGFDPFGLKPTDAKDFANMQTKELNNGRLAMLAAAGFCAQEQVNGQGILESLGF